MSTAANSAVAAAEQTVTEAAKVYLDAYTGRDSSRYQRISAWTRLLGDKPLSGVTPEDIDAAMATLASEPAKVYNGKDVDGNPIFKRKSGQRSGGTLNRYLVALAALFAWARRTRMLPRGFESPTKYVEKRNESKGRTRYLNKDEYTRLLTACRASPWTRLYLLVLMAITTGARKGELLRLRWKDLDLERGEASIGDEKETETKNGDSRRLILLPQVVEELRLFAPKDAADSLALVFRSRLRPSQPYAMAEAFRDALAEAGIKNFRFHDCRHTAASYMAQHGASLLEIADTLGHRQLRMVQRYAHLNTDSRRRLMARVFEGRL